MTDIIDKDTERMADLGRLTRGILHDLNNSLASIMGFAEFLVDDLDPSSEQHIFAQNIRKAGTQIENLVEQIRAVSLERGSNNDVMFNIIDTTKQLVESSQHLAKNNQKIIFMSEIKGAFLTLAPLQFRVMFLNLLYNSIQALNSVSGTVMVNISPAEKTNMNDLKGDYQFFSHLVNSDIDKNSLMLRIDIIDNGCGMDEATLNLAPSPHFTTKSADTAHGLGLSISCKIINYLDGQLSVSTTPNIGTRITIVLPIEKIIK